MRTRDLKVMTLWKKPDSCVVTFRNCFGVKYECLHCFDAKYKFPYRENYKSKMNDVKYIRLKFDISWLCRVLISLWFSFLVCVFSWLCLCFVSVFCLFPYKRFRRINFYLQYEMGVKSISLCIECSSFFQSRVSRLYTPLCLSVGWSVGWSVTLRFSFFF